jgi:thiamine-phosphate pyrophosphorylase
MIKGYYFITDSGLSLAGTLSDVQQAVSAGVGVVQYRNKNEASRKMLEEALELRKICRDTIFVINDRVDISLAADADGVHLGQDDLPYTAARKLLGKKRIIGLTVHSLAEAVAAQDAGVDYIGVAPIFKTTTKSDAGQPVGITGLRKICDTMTIPVVAIGGINLSNADQVIEAGAASLCAISAVITKPNVSAEIRRFQAFYQKSVHENFS